MQNDLGDLKMIEIKKWPHVLGFPVFATTYLSTGLSFSNIQMIFYKKNLQGVIMTDVGQALSKNSPVDLGDDLNPYPNFFQFV